MYASQFSIFHCLTKVLRERQLIAEQNPKKDNDKKIETESFVRNEKMK